MENISLLRSRLLPAPCGADISNGSERALYVPMSHIFKTLRRPHRAVNLMFTYYPFDKGWPKRASKIVRWKKGMGQWDLPFDDYEVYLGGPGGSDDAEAFRQFNDIRMFGQDIHFTLTIDLNVPSDTLQHIARDLRPYGRVFFRINHECNGNWFQHNKRYSYKQVSDFFVKFHYILKETAPFVKTVLCLNGYDNPEDLHVGEHELAEAVRTADVLAIDRYISLHYKWPNEFTGDLDSYFDLDLKHWWKVMKENYNLLCDIRKNDTFSFSLPELNADSDVNGFSGQARRIADAYDLIKTDGKKWINAVTMYQFRDRGGLGLELEDPKTFKFIKRLPSCSAYKKAVADKHFQPVIKTGAAINARKLSLSLKWFNSEDAEGICLAGLRPLDSTGIHLLLPKGNYLINCNGSWLHSRGGKVDLKRMVDSGAQFKVNVFAPPAEGINSRGADGQFLPYYEKVFDTLPQIIC
ncbi:MAG: hypothetical protein GX640_00960 [Fibrobacter sp.]|nr:hypothetical protein [Fibrobacter sp.]